MNRIISAKPLSFFTGEADKVVVEKESSSASKDKTYKVVRSISAYKNAADAKAKKIKRVRLNLVPILYSMNQTGW